MKQSHQESRTDLIQILFHWVFSLTKRTKNVYPQAEDSFLIWLRYIMDVQKQRRRESLARETKFDTGEK